MFFQCGGSSTMPFIVAERSFSALSQYWEFVKQALVWDVYIHTLDLLYVGYPVVELLYVGCPLVSCRTVVCWLSSCRTVVCWLSGCSMELLWFVNCMALCTQVLVYPRFGQWSPTLVGVQFVKVWSILTYRVDILRSQLITYVARYTWYFLLSCSGA